VSLHYDESQPSPLQRQIAQTRRELRARLAAKAVPDLGIDLKRKSVKTPNPVFSTDYFPPSFWEMPTEYDFTIPTIEEDPVKALSPDVVYMMHEIQDAVCAAAGVSRNDLLSRRQDKLVVLPRQVAIALCNIFTRRSYPEIGRQFGYRHHTTIMYSIERMQPVMAEIWWALNKPLEHVAMIAMESCRRHFPLSETYCNRKYRSVIKL